MGQIVAIVGSGLADRLQHDGWLETLIQQAFAEHELTIRNLAFSGDEVVSRLTSAGVRVLYPEARRGTADSRINFVHPKDAGGVLLELVEPAADHSASTH